LIQKNIENTIKYITPIKYHSTHIENKNKNGNNNPNSDNHPTFPPHSTLKGGIEIKIEPTFFKDSIPVNSLTSIKENWLINLTSITIPQEVHCLMQLGENFSLLSDKKEKNIIELIKNIEGNTNKFDIDTQLTLKNLKILLIDDFIEYEIGRIKN